MSEWVATVFVLFELCVLSPDATHFIDDGKERPIWIRPDAVTAFTRPRPAQGDTTAVCTAIQVEGYRMHVLGTPQEIYAKLTEFHPDRLYAPSAPTRLPQ